MPNQMLATMKRLGHHIFVFSLLPLAIACGQDTTGEGEGGTGATSDSEGVIEGDTSSSGGTDTGSASGGETDAGAEDTDNNTEDTAADQPDAGAAADADDAGGLDCPGASGCACDTNDACDGGICIDTANGKRCAQTCVDVCPDGFSCNKFDPGGGDSVFICTPEHVSLCSPCNQDADCQVFGASSLCVDHGNKGKFCGSACAADTDCPSDYACVDVAIGGGNKKKQCKLKDDTTTCECNIWAIDNGKGTVCSTTNDKGTCSGTRSCGKTGLSACDAAAAAAEACDGVDSDCNGKTDDIDPADFTCVKKAWFDTGSKSTCAADADCKVEGESCADDTKTCRALIGGCKGTSSCEKGKLKCQDAKTPKIELCNGEDDDCDGKADEDFVWANPKDASKVAVGGKCGLGACAGGQVKCETLSAAVCDTEKAAKADKEACNDKDDDCDGDVDEESCDDGTECTTDTCDGKTGDCKNAPAIDCDDKNQCTKDACDAKTGKCSNTLLTGGCDDGNACSEGDTCAESGGKAVCVTGATTKTCDDSNPCTDDGCDKSKGCVSLSNAATQLCYTATDKGTAGVGECKTGVRACKDGKLEPVCVGEVKPALNEACDGKDDSCDGKIDEGCKTAGVDVTFASAHATVGDSKIKLTAEVSGSSPAGSAKGTKNTAHLGFLHWLNSTIGK